MAIPKNKTIINIDDYTGFRWNGKHTSELGLTIVSSSSRYNLNPISSITNNTVDVPGGAGQYFYNATYGPKKWTINFVFEDLDDYQWRELQNWLYHKDTSDLVFDELPYKAYNAKLEGTPTVKYLCFDETKVKYNDDSIDRDTLQEVVWNNTEVPSFVLEDKNGNNFDTMYYKKRIYKGEGTLNFVSFFPYAYSARNYDGKYMKYLDEIEYFPNILAAEVLNPIPIDHTYTLTDLNKSIIQLDSIQGNSYIDQDTHIIQRGLITEATEGRFQITANNKIWTYFTLLNSDSDNEEEFITFDSVGDIYDEIIFNSTENTGKYQLSKKVQVIDLLQSELFQERLELALDEQEGNKEITLSMRVLMGEELWEQADLEPTQVDNILLSSNYFHFIPKPQDNTSLSEVSYFYIEDGSRGRGKNKKTDITIHLVDNTANLEIFNTLQNIIKDNNDFTDYEYATEYSDLTCSLFYPQKEQICELNELTNTTKPLQQKVTDSITIGCRNVLGSTNDLQYRFLFTKIPTLYDNFREWADSSGLKPSRRIEEEGLNYDDCIKVDDTESTFGYRIYNGGDLYTPFRLKLPVVDTILKDSKKEITFALAQQQNFDGIQINRGQKINNIIDLQKGVLYCKITDNKMGDYKYYFHKITNYSTNTAQFINVETGEYEVINLSNTPCSRRVKPEENLKVINSFSIRFYNKDALNSYSELIKNYTKAATASKTNNQLTFTNTLEIDTYKQTINFIVTSNLTGEETIIPMYFALSKGELFTIPPKVDNLYLLVYNQREKGNSFIVNNYKQIPEIEYRYLYL